MNTQDSSAETFDVFMCHNSEDKPAVREIGQSLAREGIKPWLDVEQIRPGTTWQTVLGEQIKSIKAAAVFVGNGGIGPWQNEEIQAFLNEFIERKCPVIPTILASVNTTPDLPWTLKNRHRVDFRLVDPDPLKQLIWGITGQKPAAREPLVSAKEEKGGPARPYPSLLKSPDPEQATQLEILRRRVKEYWVDGVLRHSLYDEVLISLGKRQMPKAVDAPWKYTVEMSDGVSSGSLEDRDVSAIYDATGLLLILGEPGSGKSTTLLDLARILLNRAEKDIRERVPIVLNLSSWKKKQPLVEWMSSELSEKYRVPRKIAGSWLQNQYLLPLLDGLDEVQTTLQPDCVGAVNAFIEEFNPSGLVVCCRLNEYRWLPERLKLDGAIRLEPLSKDEVDKYLAGGGSRLAALRKAVEADSVLQELAQTPLMLSIMSHAFREAGTDEVAAQKGESPEKRRKQIFGLYVEQMFKQKGATSLVFPKEKTIGWLSWLAEKMREHSQSVFLVEGLQPSWLATKGKRVAYGTIVASSLGLILALIYGLSVGLSAGLSVGLSAGLSIGLMAGLSTGLGVLLGAGLGCWSQSPLKNGVISGSIAGLIVALIYGLVRGLSEGLSFGLMAGLSIGLFVGPSAGLSVGLGVGSLNHITLVETISWKWNQFWKRMIPGLIVGLILGLILGLIAGLTLGLTVSAELRAKLSGGPIVGLSDALIGGLSAGLILGAIGGLIGAFVGGFRDTVKVGKAYPNQGITLSGKISFAVFLVTLLGAGLIGGLIGISNLIKKEPHLGLIGGIIIGLSVGLISGLNRGGSAVIKHYALRLILWLKGYTPFRFIKFLDHSARLILLKKVGGGYIFIHRMLLDYFADLTPQSTRAGDTTTGPK